jgi:6-phosphofructokinase 1
MRRIGISTGGGDAPGLNAVIRAVVLSSLGRGWEVVGIRDGYDGLLAPERFPQGGLIPLDRNTVRGITHLGGSIIGTTNRGNPMSFPVEQADGSWREVDRLDELIAAFHKERIDSLIAVGGDGSLAIAAAIARKGFQVIGVPKTIDNDLSETVITFGFDTAVGFATECIGRLHSTAEAHRRVMVVEVMGRYAGWIALHCGVSATADVILIPEIPYDIGKVAAKIEAREQMGRCFSVVVVAEGAKPLGGDRSVVGKEVGQAERLGGAGERVAAELKGRTGKETRLVVLGHLLRGGSPTTFDRLIAMRFGAAAVRALEQGVGGMMVALDPPQVNYVPLERATRRMKTVPVDGDVVTTARDLGISFGD